MSAGKKLWLDRVFNLVTGLAVLASLYLIATERVAPALRARTVRVVEGERLPRTFRFERVRTGLENDEGEVVEVPGRAATLLLVYDSTCPACYANLDAWRSILAHADRSVVPLAVALERDRRAAAEYGRQNLANVPVTVPRDPRRFADAFGVDLIPYTALVHADGTLIFARSGSLDSLAVRSLLGALEALEGSSTRLGKDGEG